ncbi:MULTISPECIES: ABC transporter permease [Metabacillus]|uniref:Iron ABC transporter permease n=2 Tax=Metabacillus TaxID=2675233 RepID=A0A179T4C1_9BACI|nr:MULTISPECIES: iron ABC transporter permease [Metabacillus]OAS88198.1 iron ABC transporter permease [Metabacillus litoralis]QNF27371.1 iron ABC transporter permease [Metabacillus sp. KUDC1714]
MKILKNKTNKFNPVTIILSLFIMWFIFAFLVFPNVNTIYETFFGTGTFSLEPVQKLLGSERAVESILNSIILAIILVFTVNIIGVSLVLIIHYFDIKGSRIIKFSYYTTLIYSGVALNYGYKLVYGENSLLTKFLLQVNPNLNESWFSGLFAVAFVMTFACTSNHVLFLSSALKNVDYQTIEASKNLGASQITILKNVVLPTLKPTLFALTILTFLAGLAATSAPLVFGGDDFETITPMILTFANSSSSKDLATVLALILGIVTIIVLSFMLRSEEKGNYISISKTKTSLKKQKIENKTVNIIVHIAAYLLFIIYMMPVLTIIVYSLTDSLAISSGVINIDSLTFNNYLLTFSSVESLQPYLISLGYGLTASFLVVVFCLLCSYLMKKYQNRFTKWLDYLLMIPWFLPSTLIAVGLTVTFNKSQWVLFNQFLTGTLWLLLIGYIVANIPFTLRITKSAFFGINNEIDEAAKNLGANPFYTFVKVLLPIIIPSILGVFALNFIGILPDYDLTVFLYHPLYEPLGITIMNATGNSATADTKALSLVYTVILMVINTIILTLVYGNLSFNRRKNGGYE